jgi:hypothetical protein
MVLSTHDYVSLFSLTEGPNQRIKEFGTSSSSLDELFNFSLVDKYLMTSSFKGEESCTFKAVKPAVLQVVHPGKMIINGREAAISIKGLPLNEFISGMITKEKLEDLDYGLQHCTNSSPDVGITVFINDRRFYLFGDEQKTLSNFTKAFNYVRDNFLLDMPSSDILKQIKRVHSLVFKGVNEESSFRKKLAYVQRLEGDEAALISFVNKYGDDIDRLAEKPSKSFLTDLKEIAFVPAEPAQISQLMEVFVEELKRKKEDPSCDAISLAAFAHQSITVIHPFEDANGRTARIFMQIILLKQGETPVVFSDDDEYSKSVQGNYTDTFTCYLRNVVARMNQVT